MHMKKKTGKIIRTVFLILLFSGVVAALFYYKRLQDEIEAGYDFRPADVPAFDGMPYTVLNDNKPAFSGEEKKRTDPFEEYSEQDDLGRCGPAYANICRELMPEEKRGEIGEIKPVGWRTARYDGLIEGNYLYNRCHLIAYSLAGENANKLNLITGTRYLNIEGMQPFEIQVADYARYTGNHVLYRVTPVYRGNNLIADGVRMEAWSVEDEGEGVCFNIFCYNVQPGIRINYLTGESEAEEQGTSGVLPVAGPNGPEDEAP